MERLKRHKIICQKIDYNIILNTGIKVSLDITYVTRSLISVKECGNMPTSSLKYNTKNVIHKISVHQN